MAKRFKTFDPTVLGRQKLLLVMTVPSANNYLPQPLNPAEKVLCFGLSDTRVGKEQFIKIRQCKPGATVQTLSTRYFAPFNSVIESKLKKRYHIK